MQLTKTRRRHACEIGIAPLIDVVFLLIIFFMTISQISRVEAENLTLPEASEGTPVELAPQGRLIVNVPDDGRVVIAGETCSPTRLEELLTQARDERGPGNLTALLGERWPGVWSMPFRRRSRRWSST